MAVTTTYQKWMPTVQESAQVSAEMTTIGRGLETTRIIKRIHHCPREVNEDEAVSYSHG